MRIDVGERERKKERKGERKREVGREGWSVFPSGRYARRDPVWCWSRCPGLVLVSRSRVGNRFGGSCSCNARTHVYVSPWHTHRRADRACTRTQHAHTHATALPGSREDSPTRTCIIHPRYWSKYSVTFTYES